VNTCTGDEYDEAASTLQLAELNFGEYLATDQSSANKIREAARNTAMAVNTEITNRSLRPEAVLNAAKSAIQLGTGFSRSGVAQPRVPQPGKTLAPCDKDDAKKEALRSVTENSKRIRMELAAALNSLDSLTSACAFAAPQSQPLVVSQESISIAAKQRFNLHVEGGRTPYFFEWIRRPQGVSAEMSGPQTIAIVAEDKVTGEGELRVLDSQPMSQSKVVSVKTQ
jgi:hypothetical protein